MRSKRSLLYLLLLGVFSAASWAAIDTYDFATEEQRSRFATLTEELRCPKCQNQNIADSDAPIAFDLRRAIYEQIQAGATDDQIIDFMVVRYGDFVLYKPAFNTKNLLLWGAPLLFLLLGVLLLLRMIKQRGQSDGAKPLSEQEQRRVQALLQQVEQDNREQQK